MRFAPDVDSESVGGVVSRGSGTVPHPGSMAAAQRINPVQQSRLSGMSTPGYVNYTLSDFPHLTFPDIA
jgi:hypothetical protein